MRLSVTQIRILILAGNLLLGLGVPGYAAYRYWHLGNQPEGPAVVTDLARFQPRDEGPGPAVPDSRGKLLVVSTWLQPKLPPPPDQTPTADKPGDQKPADGGAEKPGESSLEPGKLGEDGWTYYPAITGSDPMRNYVILRKKEPVNPTILPPGGGPGSARTSSRTRPTPRLPTRSTRPGKIAAQQPSDRIDFHVSDRRYTNEELGLDFMIHSADEKQFVYWLPDNPKKKFALKYETESAYLQDPDDGLRPKPKTPEELAAEGPPEAKKKKLIVRSSKQFDSVREKEYQEMLQGIGLEPISAPSDGGLRTIKPPPGAESTPGAPGPESAKPGAASRTPGGLPGAAARVPRPPTAAEAQQLKQAIDAIPPASQKELLEGLKKAGVGSPK